MTEQSVPPAAHDSVARAADLERRIADIEATSRARLVRAELKAEAIRAGMVDLDGLKLLDSAAVTFDEAGEVTNANEVMREMKRAKPYLFGSASSSSTSAPPPAQPPKQRQAKEMTHAEWQAARADLVKRR